MSSPGHPLASNQASFLPDLLLDMSSILANCMSGLVLQFVQQVLPAPVGNYLV